MELPQEFCEQQLQEMHFQRLHALVLDKIRLSERFQLRSHRGARPQTLYTARVAEFLNSLYVEIDDVLVKNRIRQVRAAIEGAAVMDSVERVERDEARMHFIRQ